MTAYLPPVIFGQEFNANGDPLVGGLLYTYVAGTSTPQVTYTDAAGTVPNTNPIVLDASGRYSMRLGTGLSYKIVLKDADGITIRTEDNINDAAYDALNQFKTDLSDTSDVAKGDALVGVKQPLTDAVARNQHDKNKEWVTLEDFGAVGDGTADDVTKIKKAIDSGWKYIYGTPGKIYAIGAAGLALLNLTGITLDGRGASLKFLGTPTQTGSSGGSVQILLTSCTKCEIRNWTIDGNAKASNPIELDACTECGVIKNDMTNGGVQAFVFLRGGIRNKVHDNILYTGLTSVRGIWAGNTNTGDSETDVSIKGNKIRNLSASGIVIVSDGGEVVENIVDTTSAGSGVAVSGSGSIYAKNIKIHGNTFRNCNYHGVQSDCVSGAKSVGINVYGNICELNTGSGIYASDVDHWTVDGNICRDNSQRGISIQLATNSNFTGNNCYDTRTLTSRTQKSGVYAVAQTSALEMVNLNIVGNNCDNHTEDGITVNTSGSGTMNGIQVEGNSCFSNSRYGIYFGNDAGIISSSIEGNNCYGNTTYDIRAINLDNTLIGNRYGTIELGSSIYVMTNNSATPAVGPGGRQWFKCSNSSTTTITNLTGGVDGREIEILFSNANTTLTHGTYLILKGATNVTPPANSVMRFRYFNGQWYECARSF